MRIRQSLAAFAVLLGVAAGVSIASSPTVSAAAPKCYSETTSGVIEAFPACEYGLEQMGFNMGSLPNPLAADRCYFWPKDAAAPGQDVTAQCNQPPYSNAAAYGSTVPPPPALENIPAPADSSKLKISKDVPTADTCGGGNGIKPVDVAFDIGCKGQGNPILDMIFAFVRVLTTGVGFALVISIIIAGIQYTTAGGDPNKTSLAKQRLVSTVLVATPLYLLTYAILNWLVPGIVL